MPAAVRDSAPSRRDAALEPPRRRPRRSTLSSTA